MPVINGFNILISIPNPLWRAWRHRVVVPLFQKEKETDPSSTFYKRNRQFELHSVLRSKHGLHELSQLFWGHFRPLYWTRRIESAGDRYNPRMWCPREHRFRHSDLQTAAKMWRPIDVHFKTDLFFEIVCRCRRMMFVTLLNLP